MIVKMVSYCGLVSVLAEGVDEALARRRVARRLKWFRREIGGHITTLGDGRWECEEPEDCAMVPDACGFVVIEQESEDEVEG